MGRARGWRRSEPGGIAALLELIEEHRGALEYDWRARFHLPLTVIGESMTFGEALRLIKLLRADTTSQIAAACEGWDFPTTREHLAILDLFDINVLANSDPKKGKPKPHSGRPMKIDDRMKSRRGNAAGRSPEQVRAILAEYGHGVAPV